PLPLMRVPPASTLFPYTTLFRSRHPVDNCVPPAWDPTMPATDGEMVRYVKRLFDAIVDFSDVSDKSVPLTRGAVGKDGETRPWRDRKSTRLNSSHVSSSYAVLCL